jgi:fumarate reductase subunit D
MHHRRSREPLWWLPFSGGMMVDALAIPALVILTGFLIPFGLVTGHLRELLVHPLGRFAVFVIASLTFFHAAHRLKFTLIDLGLKDAKLALGVICYGAAIVGTLVAAALALGLM